MEIVLVSVANGPSMPVRMKVSVTETSVNICKEEVPGVPDVASAVASIWESVSRAWMVPEPCALSTSEVVGLKAGNDLLISVVLNSGEVRPERAVNSATVSRDVVRLVSSVGK